MFQNKGESFAGGCHRVCVMLYPTMDTGLTARGEAYSH